MTQERAVVDSPATFKNPVLRQAMASLNSAGRMPTISRAELLRTGGANVSAE